MTKIITTLLTALLFLGCSSEKEPTQPAEQKLVISQSLDELKLNDQFEKPHVITNETKKAIFVFSKDLGHLCNEYFATKHSSYLTDNKALFVADVSAAPSIIRSMFIMPGLKDFNHTILIIDNKNISKNYKTQENSEKIVVVNLENKVIKNIQYLNSTEELSKVIEKN